MNCSKDVTKHVAKRGLKMVAEGSEAAPANPDPSSVKIEHLWVLPAENLVKELNTLLAKLKGYTNQFKKSRVQLKASPKASEAAWLRQSLSLYFIISSFPIHACFRFCTLASMRVLRLLT